MSFKKRRELLELKKQSLKIKEQLLDYEESHQDEFPKIRLEGGLYSKRDLEKILNN